MENTSQSIEIFGLRKRVGFRVLVGVVATLLFAFLAFDANRSNAPLMIQGAFWVGAAIAAFFAILHVRILLAADRPLVVISPQGVLDRRLYASPIPWSAISEVATHEDSDHKNVVLALREGTRERFEGKERWFNRRPRWFGMERVEIDASLLDISPAELREMLGERAKAASTAITMGGEIVRFYQQLGFFPGQSPHALIEQFEKTHGRHLRNENPWDDVHLLAADAERAWSGDPEADVCMENKVYSKLLPEWAKLSKGAFAPTEITEFWNDESGPIDVQFHLNGAAYTIHPEHLDDWIDLEILRQINRLIEKSGAQFEYVCADNFAIVLFLTAEQRNAMRDERRFPFAF